MENSKLLKTYLLFSVLIFLALPRFSFSYSPESTHAALAQNSAKLFNLNFGNSLPEAEIENIIEGAIKEDAPSYRVLNHFYDPIYNRGLTFGGNWKSSREWAEDNFAQASLDVNYSVRNFAGLTHSAHFGGSSDFSWQRSIYEYAWGAKARGLRGLGHTLHLIQDATVPDHTRDDHHFPYLEAQLHDSSPYEKWTAGFNKSNFELDKKLKPNILLSLRAYFDDTATYSNRNFFSRHTIFDKKYTRPIIAVEKTEGLSNGKTINFLYASDGKNSYRLVGKRSDSRWQRNIDETDLSEYFIEDFDAKILSDYWNLLSKKAITNGAGVIKLFFDEVEKEKKSKVLYEKNRSWLAKKVDEFKTGTFALASLLYGSSVKPSDLNEEGQRISEVTPVASETSAVAPIIQETAEESAEPPPLDDQEPSISQSVEIPVLTTPAIPKVETVPGISLPPALGTFIGGGGAPRVEEEAPAAAVAAIPTVSLSIDECSASLATDGCLITGTALTINWSSSSTNIARYEIKCEVSGAACPGFSFNEHGTSTTYTASDGATYTFRAQSISEPGNRSVETVKSVTVNSRPVVINEIAWMGTSGSRSGDEWIELKNVTPFSINLSQWVLYSETDLKPYLNLTGTIAANGYYLIERTDDAATSVTADMTAAFGSGAGTGLSNSGEALALAYASSTIDRTPTLCSSGWCGGNTTNYQTMERYDPNALGTLSSNWGTNNQVVMNATNADASPISGTPRRRNSLNYRIILSSDTALTASKTLSLSNSPYVISEPTSISSGATLTLEPSVVIKFTNNGELTVQGTLSANGNSSNRITFTSIKDDTASGDTNNDGTGTTPAKGDWKKITFKGTGSLLNYADLRYGGHFLGNSASESRAMIFASGVLLSISNSIIEESFNMGISLASASSSVIQGNTIRRNNNTSGLGFALIGLNIGDGDGIVVSGNRFENNRGGISITNSTPRISDNIFDSNLETAVSLHAGAGGTIFEGNTAINNPFNGISINQTVFDAVTLSANLPYTGTLTINAAGALTIPAGAIFKGIEMTSSGLLRIEGSLANPVIFTALKDDAYGGDTNNDGDSIPEPGAWKQVEIKGNTATSTISDAVFRFGNSVTSNGALYINGGRAEIQNTTVEYSRNQGVQINPAGIASILNSTFRNNGTGVSNDGSLSLAGSVFRNNTTGLASPAPSTFIDGGGNDIDSTNTTRTTPVSLLP